MTCGALRTILRLRHNHRLPNVQAILVRMTIQSNIIDSNYRPVILVAIVIRRKIIIEWIQNIIWQEKMVLIVVLAVLIVGVVPYTYAFARHVLLGERAPNNMYSDIKKIVEKINADKQLGRPATVPEKYRLKNALSWRRIRKELETGIHSAVVIGICIFAMTMLALKLFPQQAKSFLGITRASELIFVYSEDGLENQLILEKIANENGLESVSVSVLKENIKGKKKYNGIMVLEIDQDDKSSLTYLLASKVFSEELKTKFLNEFDLEGCVLLSVTANENLPIYKLLVAPRSDEGKFIECVNKYSH